MLGLQNGPLEECMMQHLGAKCQSHLNLLLKSDCHVTQSCHAHLPSYHPPIVYFHRAGDMTPPSIVLHQLQYFTSFPPAKYNLV